jgi:hypothetical protein
LELLELVKNVGLKVNLLLLNEDEILKEKALHLFENEVIFFTTKIIILATKIFKSTGDGLELHRGW